MTGGREERAEPYPPMFPGGNRIGVEEEAAVLEVVRSKRLFRYGGIKEGPSAVEAFEVAFAATLSVRHAIAVGSGTLALMTALAAARVGPGDQVIVPAYTWVSTAAAVLAVGAVPVIAEVDDTLTIDVEDAARRINDRTKAIIPVHMRGAPADMDAVSLLAERVGLFVIEDAAQAIGGRYRGRRLGTIGDLGCFSLQFNKIITCGEGGVVASDDRKLYERALLYQDVAASQRSHLDQDLAFFGIVARMSELQGAVACVQVRKLDDIVGDCRANRARISAEIASDLAEHGIHLRRCHDPAGDTGIALVLLCPDAPTAKRLSSALSTAQVPVRVLFEPDREDLHVAYHWRPLLKRQSWSRTTPWDQAGVSVDAGPESWERSLDVLGRAVHIDVSPDLTESHIDRLVGSLRTAVARS